MSVLVSVVIPTYNRANKIFTCLESIVSQTYKSIEIIVVDDGSTDDTELKISNRKSGDSAWSNVVYYKQVNQGAPIARNFGLTKSTGKYVVFFDSDDVMLPTRIEKQVNTIESEGSDSCTCGFVNSVTGETYIPSIENGNDYIGSLIHWKLLGSTQCWMYRRDILVKIGGYNVNYSCYQDWDITFRYLVASKKVSLVKESLSVFVDDESFDRITRQVQSDKRIPYIGGYYLNVFRWLLYNGKNYKLINEVIFFYVANVTLAYKKMEKQKESKASYFLFKEALDTSGLLSKARCNFLYFKHYLKGMSEERKARA
ncbi:MAG: glycosyltransferase family A protein [Bacteroidota bacterium]